MNVSPNEHLRHRKHQRSTDQWAVCQATWVRTVTKIQPQILCKTNLQVTTPTQNMNNSVLASRCGNSYERTTSEDLAGVLRHNLKPLVVEV